MSAAPSGDELAAIVAALASLQNVPAVDTTGGGNAWATAARYPELEFDELHAFVRRANGPCSTKF